MNLKKITTGQVLTIKKSMSFTGKTKMPRLVNPSAKAEDKPDGVLDIHIMINDNSVVNSGGKLLLFVCAKI